MSVKMPDYNTLNSIKSKIKAEDEVSGIVCECRLLFTVCLRRSCFSASNVDLIRSPSISLSTQKKIRGLSFAKLYFANKDYQKALQ